MPLCKHSTLVMSNPMAMSSKSSLQFSVLRYVIICQELLGKEIFQVTVRSFLLEMISGCLFHLHFVEACIRLTVCFYDITISVIIFTKTYTKLEKLSSWYIELNVCMCVSVFLCTLCITQNYKLYRECLMLSFPK